jgi:hypothetical protein
MNKTYLAAAGIGLAAALVSLSVWMAPAGEPAHMETPASPQHADAHHAPSGEPRPLELLMVELGQDMQRLNEGIWRDDYVMIERGARAVADHPPIPPEQVALIRAALGPQFESFRQFDVLVHERAAEIAEAASSARMDRVLALYGQVQEGCVGCHAAYRDRTRAALYGTAGGN